MVKALRLLRLAKLLKLMRMSRIIVKLRGPLLQFIEVYNIDLAYLAFLKLAGLLFTVIHWLAAVNAMLYVNSCDEGPYYRVLDADDAAIEHGARERARPRAKRRRPRRARGRESARPSRGRAQNRLDDAARRASISSRSCARSRSSSGSGSRN